MHREISHADHAFEHESRTPLYLLTALVGLLLLADVWPIVAGWLSAWGLALPTWPNEVGGYRIALLAAILGGARALYGAFDSLFEGRFGADLALAIACVAAILVREPLVAAEIVFIGMVGECLENLTFEHAQRSIRRIVELCPRRCWRLRDGREERILTSELQVGDQVVVKPGGRVPADGVVLEGRSALDVSALTGESLPVDRGPGDEVLAGSLNQFGALTIEARRVAEHTVVGRVIELTARALKDKAPLERTADRLARYFLPVVLGLAALTFLTGLVVHSGNWFRPADSTRLTLGEAARLSTYPALSVLVVACPCALILATPAAILAALGRLAGTGVLIKGGSALERLARVNAFAFDKTGTLTEGRLELAEVVPLGDAAPEEVLRAAGAAEQHSEHLLARLILQEMARRDLPRDPAEDFQAFPGSGVRARTPAGVVLVGNRRLLEEQGVVLPEEALALLERLDGAGQTVLFVAREGKVLGALGVRDRLRPEAASVIQELRALGIADIAMLTGDRAAVARGVAGALGITDVHAELLPDQKADLVARETGGSHPPLAGGRRVAMVGDGINDAPALARADVGVAVGGSGADLAAEAGDVVLMVVRPNAEPDAGTGPLRSLPLLVRLARATVAIIRQNILIFAFGVNGVGILLTAWLWPILAPERWYEQGPVAAVIYHQLGSLAVLLNAMRLLWFERVFGEDLGSSQPLRVLRERLVQANDWMEHRLDLDEGFHWLGHHWRPVLAGLFLLGLLSWAGSGLTAIGPDEVGLVRRFGRVLPEDLGPGLHWRWPWPVEVVTRVQPGRVQTIEIGFRTRPGSTAVPASGAWSSSHGSEGLSIVPDEALMITGDGNLLELQGTIRYTIADPRVFLFEVSDAPGLLHDAAESVLREVVASHTFADLLTTGRERFQKEALAKLRIRCQEDGPHGLGLSLREVALHDLHPPQEVVPAYHRVAQAMETRDRLVNDAEAERVQARRVQEGKSLEVVRQAQAEALEKVRLARARRDEFLARYRARTRLGPAREWDLYRQALEAVAQGQAPEEAGREYVRRRGEALAEQAALTDFRLFWERVGTALAGRDKVLVDADRVPGRRSLWLMAPELFRPIVPEVLRPRLPAARGPAEQGVNTSRSPGAWPAPPPEETSDH